MLSMLTIRAFILVLVVKHRHRLMGVIGGMAWSHMLLCMIDPLLARMHSFIGLQAFVLQVRSCMCCNTLEHMGVSKCLPDLASAPSQ